MGLRGSEWLAVGYFLYLAICAGIVRSTPTRTTMRRLSTAAAALGAALMVVLVAHVGGVAQVEHAWLDRTVVREWAPAVYLLLAYWLPGGIAASPNAALEARFMAWDRWLLGPPAGRLDWLNRPSARAAAEIIYPLVHVMVLASFALLRIGLASPAAERFWLSVLAAGFVCYGTLPWLHLRPPRRFQDRWHTYSTATTYTLRWSRRVRAWNERLLDIASVGASTFPSAHVANALAAALIVTEASVSAGVVLLLLTALITLATVAGRYHYAIDALAGLLAGAGAWAVARLLG